METRHILVTSYEDGTHEIFCEWYAHFWPKDSVGDDGKVSIPRASKFLFTIVNIRLSKG
jgi:hypothetical protein